MAGQKSVEAKRKKIYCTLDGWDIEEETTVCIAANIQN
jgi:hypothetical protein